MIEPRYVEVTLSALILGEISQKNLEEITEETPEGNLMRVPESHTGKTSPRHPDMGLIQNPFWRNSGRNVMGIHGGTLESEEVLKQFLESAKITEGKNLGGNSKKYSGEIQGGILG